MKMYEFTFENGDRYFGTVEDKNEFIKNLTKREKAEMGKIIAKKELTEEEVNAWFEEVDKFLTWV